MNMKNVLDELNRLFIDLKETRTSLLRELDHCPPGALQCHLNHGRYQYKQVTYESGKRRRRGITQNRELLHGLARKQYLHKYIEILEDDISILSDALQRLRVPAPESIISGLMSYKNELPIEYYTRPLLPCSVSHDDSDLSKRLREYQRWADEPYERSRYRPEKLKKTTLSGLKVRSKSEAMIANTLFERGIPFRYEQVIFLGDGYLTPDFTFMTADGSELYWEHAGMLTDPIYSLRHHQKMIQYETAGILPWKNLIVTYDIDNEINTQSIDAMIKHFLMPAL